MTRLRVVKPVDPTITTTLRAGVRITRGDKAILVPWPDVMKVGGNLVSAAIVRALAPFTTTSATTKDQNQ